MTGEFHFLRPFWWLALVPLAALAWANLRRRDAGEAWHGVIAPHLLPHLLRGETRRRRFSPPVLTCVGWIAGTIAIAGPAWRREPAPFADDVAPVAIVLKVTPSMLAEDVQPTRLARAAQKIHDLLGARAGAKATLIAYAGTAHVVMPLTTDGGIIDTFAAALDPKVMPADGDAAAEALRLADSTLDHAGSVVWIADAIAPEQRSALADRRRSSGLPTRLLAATSAGPEFDRLRSSAAPAGAEVVRLAADDSDVVFLARAARFSASPGGEASDRWQEAGYWLTPLLAGLVLPFFRRGWMASTGAQV